MKAKAGFLVSVLGILTLFACIGMPGTGCATLSNIFHSTTQPVTPADQFDAFQRDLDFAKANANVAHELGAWQKTSDWTNVQKGFANAQLVLSSARKTYSTGTLSEQDVTNMLNSVAQAIHDAKEAAK